MKLPKVSPISGRVSEHKLSDLVQEDKRVRLDSKDSPEPRIPRCNESCQALVGPIALALV